MAKLVKAACRAVGAGLRAPACLGSLFWGPPMRKAVITASVYGQRVPAAPATPQQPRTALGLRLRCLPRRAGHSSTLAATDSFLPAQQQQRTLQQALKS